MKNSRLFKAICLAINIIFILSSVPFSAAAADQPQIGAMTLDDGQLHDIIEKSTSKLPDELLQNLSLRESDIPEAMKNTDVRETEAVARLKAREDDMSSLIYVNRDGTYTEYFFSENVKYEKGGIVSDKSNKLTSSLKRGGYINEENDINVRLPYMITKNAGIELSYEDYSIEFIPADTGRLLTAADKTKENTVIYNNAFGKGISLEYTAQFSGIKENIIMSSDTGVYDFAFTVKTHGLYLKTLDNHAVLCDNKDEAIAEIGGLIIFDADGKPGEGSFEIKEIEHGEEYVYTGSVSEEFIKSVDTVFPVTIDPTLTYNSGAYIHDSQINNYSSYSMYPNASAISVGGTGTVYKSRMLMKFINAVKKARQIGSNNLRSVTCTVQSSTGISTTVYIKCYRMSVDWSTTATSGSSAIWAGMNASTEKSFCVWPSNTMITISMLDYFLYWTGQSDDYNYGIMLKISDESTSNTVTFASKEYATSSMRPYVTIKYGIIPAGQSSTIKDNSLYTIKSATNVYLFGYSPVYCNRTNNSTYSLSFTSTATTSSTLDSSPFFAFRYVTNGYYTISPTNANFRGSSALYDEGLNKEYFLYRNGTNITLQTISGSDNNAYWYPVAAGDGIYYLINKGNIDYCLGFTGNLSGITYTPDDYVWKIDFVGLDVPLFRQEDPNTCGSACARMLLKYYGITVNETDISHNYIGQIKTGINSYLAPPNGTHSFILYTKPNSNNIISPYDNIPVPGTACSFYDRIVNEIAAGNPIIVQIAISGTSQYLPYSTSGHYILIKGIFSVVENNETVTYCITDDSYAEYSGHGDNLTLTVDNSGEYVIPYTALLSYIKQHDYGWSIIEE